MKHISGHHRIRVLANREQSRLVMPNGAAEWLSLPRPDFPNEVSVGLRGS
jgi:hypothetical protein